MSKFCPFCDDVKDSELESAEDLKDHLAEEHKDEVVETGEPTRPDQMKKPEPEPIQADYQEVETDE